MLSHSPIPIPYPYPYPLLSYPYPILSYLIVFLFFFFFFFSFLTDGPQNSGRRGKKREEEGSFFSEVVTLPLDEVSYGDDDKGDSIKLKDEKVSLVLLGCFDRVKKSSVVIGNFNKERERDRDRDRIG